MKEHNPLRRVYFYLSISVDIYKRIGHILPYQQRGDVPIMNEGKTMVNVVLVWNPQKTECVGFVEREPNGEMLDCGSDGDAEHAAGGDRWNPVSSLADSFREQYEDDDDECFIQTVEVDQSSAIQIERAEY